MSKLRNHSGNTTVGMAQWIGRKIRHHDPVSGADDHIKTRAGGQMRVGINAADPLEVVYVTAGS